MQCYDAAQCEQINSLSRMDFEWDFELRSRVWTIYFDRSQWNGESSRYYDIHMIREDWSSSWNLSSPSYVGVEPRRKKGEYFRNGRMKFYTNWIRFRLHFIFTDVPFALFFSKAKLAFNVTSLLIVIISTTDPIQCTSEDEFPGEIVTGRNKTYLGDEVTLKLKLNVEVKAVREEKWLAEDDESSTDRLFWAK